MPTVKVDWLKNMTFVGTDASGHSVVLSGDEEAIGVRPSQMLLVALAACTGYDVVAIMEKKRKPISKLEITVEGNQQEESPYPYRNIHVIYRVSGKDITEKAIAQAIQLSEEKYCSVAATIRGVAEITTEYIIEEG